VGYFQYPIANRYATATIAPASRRNVGIGRGKKLSAACAATINAHGMRDAAMQ
jgi:hypothetical protein